MRSMKNINTAGEKGNRIRGVNEPKPRKSRYEPEDGLGMEAFTAARKRHIEKRKQAYLMLDRLTLQMLGPMIDVCLDPRAMKQKRRRVD